MRRRYEIYNTAHCFLLSLYWVKQSRQKKTAILWIVGTSNTEQSQSITYSCRKTATCTAEYIEPDPSIPGIKSLDVYYKNSFLFNAVPVKHLRFCNYIKVEFGDNSYIKSYYLSEGLNKNYCYALLKPSLGTDIESFGNYTDPYSFTAGDYRFVPVRWEYKKMFCISKYRRVQARLLGSALTIMRKETPPRYETHTTVK